MICGPNGDRVNLFALVVYIPDPLGKFLDDLRRELVASFKPHAHVTILPPRPLMTVPEVAAEEARVLAADFAPFEIEAAEVEIFPATKVIYIGIGEGSATLRTMHYAMNRDALAFKEPFAYHPHITLGQELPPDDVGRLLQLARLRWAQFQQKRSFRAETVTFVQNTLSKDWIDLAEFSLGAVASLR